MRKYLFYFLLTLTSWGAVAQSIKPISEAIQIVNEKKIIYPKELNFPNNTTVLNILYLLPEMLARPTGTDLSNYEIKIDGTSVEAFRSAALNNTKIFDVASIEIKESPTASYDKNATSGTIDIKLNKAEDKPAGNIELSGGYPFYILPSALYIAQKKKWEIKLYGTVNYGMDDKDKETETYVNSTGLLGDQMLETNRNNFWSELLRAYLNYRPTERDLLKICISEMYTHTRSRLFQTPYQMEEFQANSSYTNNFRILANTEYEHKFQDRSVLDIEVNYNFSPLTNGYDDEERSLSYLNDKHTLGGKAEYSFHFLAPEKKNTLRMFLGSNYDMQFSNDESEDIRKHRELDYSVNCNYINLSPYLQLEGKFGNFSFKAIGEYQFYDYITQLETENKSTITKNDYTCKLMTAWRFHPKHRLRLILDRKLNRPSNKQLYPHLVYSSAANSFVLGNPSLDPSETKQIKLEYISGLDWEKSSMMIDASVSYIFTDNIIKAKGNQTLFGFPYTYTTYVNEGNNKSINANLMVNFRAGKYTGGLSANAYFNKEENNNQELDHYNYANFSLISAYNFNKGWDLKGSLNYYGNIDTKSGKLGDCLSLDIGGGKEWKKWSLMGYVQLPLTGQARNTIYGEINTEYIKAFLVQPSFGLNIRYQF